MTGNDISVLLVDDDDLIRDCVTAYLEDEGFRVHGATSAEVALELCPRIHPVVCISDMRLPGMDGEKFIIAAHALCPATRFFIHSGMLYTLSDELKALGMTAEDVLLKPVHDLSKLVEKIKHSIMAERDA